LTFWAEPDPVIMRSTIVEPIIDAEIWKAAFGNLEFDHDVIYWQSLFVGLFTELGTSLKEQRAEVCHTHAKFPLVAGSEDYLTQAEVADVAKRLGDIKYFEPPASSGVKEVDDAVNLVFDTGELSKGMLQVAEAIKAGVGGRKAAGGGGTGL
jgi:hypothetical protein